VALTKQPGGLGIAKDGYVSLALLHQAEGDAEGANRYMEQAEQIGRISPRPDVALQLLQYVVHLQLAQGDIPQAQLSLERVDIEEFDPAQPAVAPNYSLEPAYMALLRLNLARGRSGPRGELLRGSIAISEKLIGHAERQQRLQRVIELLLLQALAYEALGQSDAALQAIGRAVSLAEPEGYVRMFVDEGQPAASLLTRLLKSPLRSGVAAQEAVARQSNKNYIRGLLGAFNSAARTTAGTLHASPPTVYDLPAQQGLVEPLSARELEVLKLVAAGLSTQEVASRLIITPGTLRNHLKSIYGKLDAHSRVQAVGRARELGLL
jgi:LuxR family maltose regulon positive regulatory protein